MTPPDSGELRHECRCGYHIVGRDAEGAHTWSKCKPDSGESEVRPAMPVSEYEKLSQYAKGWHDRGVIGTMEFVSLPLSLAQRILAALYAAGMGALADELRESIK